MEGRCTEAVLHQSHLQAAWCTGMTLTQQPSSWPSTEAMDTLLSSVLHKSIHPHTHTDPQARSSRAPPASDSFIPHTDPTQRDGRNLRCHGSAGGAGHPFAIHVWKVSAIQQGIIKPTSADHQCFQKPAS